MGIHRRQFVAGASAAALTAGMAGCGPKAATGATASDATQQAGAIEPVTDELVQSFLAEGLNEGDPTNPATDVVTSWDELTANPDLMERAKTVVEDVSSKKLVAKAVADGESPDFIQFATPEFGKDGELAAGEFVLNDVVLRSIAEANGYTAALKLETRPTVIFGLRGCALPGDDASSASGADIKVREAAIDHVRRRCLVGVWDTGTGNIQAFSGSTVPNLVNMQYYLFWRFSQTAASDIKWAKTTACLLPQGLHSYTVGVHLRREPPARRQAGALVQTTATPILRAKDDVGYTVFDEWDPLDWEPGGAESGMRLVGVNIHAGVNHSMPPYASKGCQTIFGWYKDPATPDKLWKDFQNSLGVTVSQDASGAVKFTKEGTVYNYMLATGREARLLAAAAGNPSALATLRRVRLGSTGAPAAALRSFLKMPAGNSVDGNVMLSLLKWQEENDVPRDGVVTPKLSTDWKLNVL
jgi:hypothetical protein